MCPGFVFLVSMSFLPASVLRIVRSLAFVRSVLLVLMVMSVLNLVCARVWAVPVSLLTTVRVVVLKCPVVLH